MAQLNPPSAWVRCGPEEVKVGTNVKVVEAYENGPVVIYEGKVDQMGAGILRFAAGPPAWKADQIGCKVSLFREPKKLPMALGSAIKVFDQTYLRERIAVCQVHPDAETSREIGWYFVGDGWGEASSRREVPTHLLESAEILFDASGA